MEQIPPKNNKTNISVNQNTTATNSINNTTELNNISKQLNNVNNLNLNPTPANIAAFKNNQVKNNNKNGLTSSSLKNNNLNS